MNIALTAKIKRKLHKELIRRKLIQFFEGKGYESFDTPLYPPICYDMPIKIPHLYTKLEIVPTVEETNAVLGVVKLNWKMFVLGNQRIDLGVTTHAGQTDLVRAVLGEPNSQLPTEFTTTPKKVIEFILKILENSKAGFVDLPANFQLPPGALTLPLLSRSRNPRLGPSGSGAFYSRAR